MGNELPKGWKWVTLGDIAFKKSEKVLPKDYPNAKFIGMDCINPHATKPHFLYDFKDFKSAGNTFEKGHVIYGRMRPYLNKVYKAEFDGACSGEFIVLQCSDLYNPDLLKYVLHSADFVRFACNKTSGDRPRISYEEIIDYPIALAPVSEQSKIIYKIEELFSDLDKGIESLKTAQLQLKTYRQAVLKYAFEGRFTNAEVKEGELPNGWKRTKLIELSDLITKGASPKWQGFNYIHDPSELLFVTSENVRDNYIDISVPKFLEKNFNNIQKRSILKNGDVLFNLVGASIGRAAVFNLDVIANINQAVAIIRLKPELNNKYLSYFLNSEGAKQKYLENVVDFARANLSLTDTNNILIPHGSIQDQHRVISEIDSRLSVCDKVEETIEASLLQSESLRQSILKKAFEGKLINPKRIE